MRISDWSSDVCSSDLTDAASWNNAIAAAVEAFGGLTTLSNTAGIIHPGGFEEESIEGWNKMVAVNQTAIFLGIKAAIPELVKSGNGSIINISSLIGMFPTAGNASYCATKAAVDRKSTRSEEHTSELQSLMRISYAVFCMKNNTFHNYNTSDK